jgi:hypothetical protein
VRDRSEVTASNLKNAEMIPPSEVRQAIIYFIKEQIGLCREDLPVMVSWVFGFKSTSAKVKELVDKTLTSMHEAGAMSFRVTINSFLPDRTRNATDPLAADGSVEKDGRAYRTSLPHRRS